VFNEAKDDGSGGDNWTTGAIGRAKLQSNHHQQANILFFTGRMPFLSPNQHCQSTEGKKYHIPWTCLPQAHLGIFQLASDEMSIPICWQPAIDDAKKIQNLYYYVTVIGNTHTKVAHTYYRIFLFVC